MATTSTSTAVAAVEPVFTEPERLAPRVPSHATCPWRLSRFLILGLRVAYLRWLDVHAASCAGQWQGDLALG